jgi:hypothetical protein
MHDAAVWPELFVSPDRQAADRAEQGRAPPTL